MGRMARLGRLVWRASEAVSVALFGALFLTFVAQVFWRYVLKDPLVWTLEVTGVLFVVLSLFTALTQMPFRDHVSLDLAVDALPGRLARALRAVSLLAFAVVMLWSIPDTIRVLEWMYDERTFVLDINLGHLFVLMMVFVTIYSLRALRDAVRLLGGRSLDPGRADTPG